MNGEKKYAGFDTYKKSKLANVMFTYELAKESKGLELLQIVYIQDLCPQILEKITIFLEKCYQISNDVNCD